MVIAKRLPNSAPILCSTRVRADGSSLACCGTSMAWCSSVREPTNRPSPLLRGRGQGDAAQGEHRQDDQYHHERHECREGHLWSITVEQIRRHKVRRHGDLRNPMKERIAADEE